MVDFIKKVAVIVVILFIVYTGIMFGMPYYRYYAFKTDAADIVRFQYTGTEKHQMEKLEAELIERGTKVGVPIGVQNIKIQPTETGFRADIKWKETVNILGQYHKTLAFEVEVSS